MNELIQTLNATNGERLFWYSVFILIFVNLIVKGILSFYKTYKKYKKEENENIIG